jgi:predicted nucleic acid-binding protein
MSILLDTNILLRSIQPFHPDFVLAQNAIACLIDDGENTNIAVQNIIEFWAVATRPKKENGLGMDFDMLAWEVAKMKRLFRVLPETTAVLPEWERLVATYRVSGKKVHDVRLVSLMNINGIKRILTFNMQDFTRFEEIEAVHPRSFA